MNENTVFIQICCTEAETELFVQTTLFHVQQRLTDQFDVMLKIHLKNIEIID